MTAIQILLAIKLISPFLPALTSKFALVFISEVFNGIMSVKNATTGRETHILTMSEVRERRDDLISDGFEQDPPVLIDALPSIGKSFGVVKWAAETGNPITIFTARHELFEQYADWCESYGLRSRILPSFHTDCETANGDHGDKWKAQVTKEYQHTGLLPGELHKQAKKLFGEGLPCQREGNCSYLTARDFDISEYDVIIGHYRHAHVPDRVDGRYVVFDEFPEGDFLTEYSADRVTTAVSEYLSQHSDLPFEYLKDLKEFRRNPERKREAIDWFECHNPSLRRDVSSAVMDRSGSAHPDAAVMTYAILCSEDLDNRWEFARLPDGRTVVINPKDDSLTILNWPALDGSKSVIALDGTPTIAKWELMLGSDLLHYPVLTDEEKRIYLRDTLDIHVVQTTEAANHYSGRSAISVTPQQDLTLFEAVGHRENACPALLTSRSALQKYNEYGLTQIVSICDHYGNLKGSNEFATTRVGIVAGSEHYGDEYIKRWAALAGKSASRLEATRGMEQDFGPFGNQILQGMRENEVLQAILRFGRDGNGATVYVHTAAIPDWIELSATVTDIHPWPDGMYQILDGIHELAASEWRTKDLTNLVTISDNQVRTHLNTLVEFGYIGCRDEGRGYTWFDKKLDQIGQRGHVEFTDTIPHK